jgi:hypothetical protein
MKKPMLLLIVGVTYGYLYSSQSFAPTGNEMGSLRSQGRSISSIPADKTGLDLRSELSPRELKIGETLSANEFEKNLASLFVFHSRSDSMSDADYFKLRQSIVSNMTKDPTGAVASLKKAFSLAELSADSYERSSLLMLARALPETERKQIAELSLQYLEKEFPKSALNTAELRESSELSLPMAAFEDAYRLKKQSSPEIAKQWAKQLISGCKNSILKQALADKEAKILSESA